MSTENFNNENSLESNDLSAQDSSVKPKNKWLLPSIFVIVGIVITVLFFKAGDLKNYGQVRHQIVLNVDFLKRRFTKNIRTVSYWLPIATFMKSRLKDLHLSI